MSITIELDYLKDEANQNFLLVHVVVSRRATQDPGSLPLLPSPLHRSPHQMHPARGGNHWEVFKESVWKWVT